MTDPIFYIYDHSDMVHSFHQAYGQDIDSEDTPELRQLRARLVIEEAWELAEALVGTANAALMFQTPPYKATVAPNWSGPKPLTEVAKESADLKYVAHGTDIALGIDGDRAFEIVHESNMSKLGEDGKPIYREDGKVLKGPNYKAPDLSEVVL